MKKRNAFTITKLIIVIAVIAALAAVLIPTFSFFSSTASKEHSHKWSDPIWNWDGLDSATAVFKCQDENCHQTETVFASASNGLVKATISTQPSCVEAGEKIYTANIVFDGTSYTSINPTKEILPPHGHDFGEWQIAQNPTCTKPGFETRVCNYDSSHKETREIEACGHNYVATIVNPTCTEEGYTSHVCSLCGDHYEDDFIPATGHDGDPCSICGLTSVYVKLPNAKKYLYRVGNQNEVAASLLFGGPIENTVVTSQTIAGNANATYSSKTFTFAGMGVVIVTVTIREGLNVNLPLEVIDAFNATSAVNATDKDVVLLSDIVTGNNTLQISNGHHFYGNGFTITNRSSGYYLNAGGMYTGYVSVTKGGTLDNVSLICNIYPKGYLYVTSGFEYLMEPGNLNKEVSTAGKNYYDYQSSGVAIFDDSTVSNCYIKGARNNILIGSGNVTVKNTVCANGSLSNIHINSSSAHTVTLEDVTTIQYLANDGFGKGKMVMGLGVLVGTEDSFDNPHISIKGNFKQYNWVCAEDGSKITSSRISKTIVDRSVRETPFQHNHNGKIYVNMGFVYMNGAFADINGAEGYSLESIEFMSRIGQVYSVASNYGSVEFKDSSYRYEDAQNAPYIPLLKIIDLPTSKPSEDSYCWNNNGTLAVQFNKGESYTFDVLAHTSFERYFGSSSDITIACSGAKVNGKNVTFSKSGEYKIIINVHGERVFDQEGKLCSLPLSYHYEIPIKVMTPDPSMANAELVVNATPNRSGVKINASGNRYYWIDLFDGLSIYDYLPNGEKEILLDGANKAAFVKKIVSISPTGTLINQNNGARCDLVFTLDDGRTLALSFQRTSASNNPGAPYGMQIKTDKDASTLYAVSIKGSAERGVNANISAKTFNCVFKLSGYRFTGYSGREVSSDSVRILSSGLYNEIWTSPTYEEMPTSPFITAS